MDINELRSTLAKNAAAARKVDSYPYPGDPTVRIGVQILRDVEIDFARVEAQRHCVKLKSDPNADPEVLEREAMRQLVWRAMVHPTAVEEDGAPVRLWLSDEDVRALPSVTIEALHRLYLEHQERRSPIAHLSDEQIASARLQTRASPASMSLSLSQLDHGSLVRICLALLAADAQSEVAR